MLELDIPINTLLQATLKDCHWCRNHSNSLVSRIENTDKIRSSTHDTSSSNGVGSEGSSSDGELKRWDIGRSRYELNKLIRPRLQRNNSSYGYNLFKYDKTRNLLNHRKVHCLCWSRSAMLVRTMQLAPKLIVLSLNIEHCYCYSYCYGFRKQHFCSYNC